MGSIAVSLTMSVWFLDEVLLGFHGFYYLLYDITRTSTPVHQYVHSTLHWIIEQAALRAPSPVARHTLYLPPRSKPVAARSLAPTARVEGG